MSPFVAPRRLMGMNTHDLAVVPDEQLLRKASDGDRVAFARIVERYQDLVRSLAYSSCGDLARSEDLAQETFVTAWLRLADLRDPARLRAWLCGIVRNLTASSQRREIRRARSKLSIDFDPVADEVNIDPATQAISHEQADIVWRTLKELSETYREPLVLYYWHGQSVAEV